MHTVALALPHFLERGLEWLRRVAEWFILLGPFGILLLAFADSFIPMAGGPDVAVILLCAREPALAPAIVVAATAGATLGATLVYLGARRAGAVALARFTPARRERVENLLGRYDILTIMMAVMLPPPFPFKVFNLGAGVFRVRVMRFVIAVLLGRLLRFSTEAVLAVRYGDEAMELMRRHGVLVLGAVASLGFGIWLWRMLAARRLRRRGESPISSE
jgi:membrane protein YqaA with SNARE-associated domain